MAPCPPAAHLTVTPLPGGKDGGEGERGGYIKERLSQWVLVSSRPLHLARWDFVYTHVCTTHTHARTTHTKDTHTTINGYYNVLFFVVVQSHVLFLRTCDDMTRFGNRSL